MAPSTSPINATTSSRRRSPPRTPGAAGLLRRTTTPTGSPWLDKLLSPFISQPAPPPKPQAGTAATEQPVQVDEGFFDGADDLSGSRFDLITAFPIEISLTIFSFLPATDLARLSAVSRAWATLLTDDLTWKAVFDATPGYRLRPSLLASLEVAPPAAADVSRPASSGTPPSSPSKLFSSLSLSPARDGSGSLAADPVQPPALPPFKTLYERRTWLARRFGRNTDPRAPGPPAVTELELDGHTDSVYALAFDGHKVLTGSRDRSLKAWDVRTGRLLQSVDDAHGASVLCIAFEEVGPGRRGEGALAVSGGSDGVVALWDLGGPGLPTRPITKVGTLTGHSQGVLDVAINAHYIVSCSKDTTILVHGRRAPHALLHTLDLHTGPVNALSLDGHALASASGDGRVRLWDLATGAFERRLKGHERGLACVSLKEGWVVSGSNDKTIKVWDAASGECLRTLTGHTDLVRSLDFSPSARLIVSGGYDKKILLWSLDTGACVRQLSSSHTSHVFGLALDAGRIVSAGHDTRAFVYDFGDEQTGRMFA